MRAIVPLLVLLAYCLSAFAEEPVGEANAPDAPIVTPVARPSLNLEQIEARIDRLMQREEMVGLGVAIVEGGEITLAKGFGETVHGSGNAVTESTVFRWASLSKGAAGTLAGLLAAEGKLALDRPVSDYRTSLRLPNGGHTRATLTHVLSHQLGIVPNAYDTRLEDGRDPAGIRRALGALKATCGVGACHTYQNVAFDTISEVVTRQTGDHFETALETRLFEPLGMRTASASRDALLASDHAMPHRRIRRTRTPRLVGVKAPYFRVPAAGGINSSVLDLALYMRAQMGLRSDVLPTPVIDTIHAPAVRTLREQRYMNRRYGGRMKNAQYGLGWRTYTYEGGHAVVGHRGAVEGYRATILFDPALDTGIAVVWNSFASNPVGLQFEVMDMVYGLEAEDWMRLDNDVS
ncbi:MAG: serine hydrolase domain-containing protein [Pseudomonadota bacterium]